MIKITTIPGDGIGQEVVESGITLLESLDLNLEFIEAKAGKDCFEKCGTTLPEETIKKAKKTKATMFGAITSVPEKKSPIITLRKELNAYANVRPIKSFEGIKSLYNDIDFIIVRENTEGMYFQNETCEKNDIAIAERVITKKASEKVINFAFNKAKINNRKKVTCVHKANVLKKTDGLFKETFYKISNNYPKIDAEDFYVDATAMYLVMKPQIFDVIVTTNLFGDILSDEAAGLVGGLGLAPSGNLGDKHGIFEPIHGSAPDIAGKKIANPIAMILSMSMMLEFLGEKYYSDKINIATENVIKKRKSLTPDLGGNAKTIDVVNAIIKEIHEIK
ncbi:homoisocitrate dehydrogenase [Methanobrevibacter filiformis]|uniref:Homoisocitrate dehydrogenase n=1 Tax=Methanobrevibacter filiformis TaxID=55758 RepID=A0A166D9W5_9EURY|nr:homoisocitrate dehydrogenase [Methanobrevibacter filiformis]KZX15356.1 homoisocitrate dehydrogenase [Methanobrevibacter filiformis]